MKRGIAEMQGERYSDAVADFSQALNLLPRMTQTINAIVIFSLGAAYLELEESEKAVENMSRAIEMDPHHSDSYSLRAFTFEKLGRCQLALDDWKERLRLVPDDGLSLRQISICLCGLGQYEEALKYAIV